MPRALPGPALTLLLLLAPLAGCLGEPPEGPALAALGAELTVHTEAGACPIPTTIAEATGLLEAASDAIARIEDIHRRALMPVQIERILGQSRYVQVHFPPDTTIELPSYPEANATHFDDLYLIWDTDADVDNVLSNGGAYGTTYPKGKLEEKARAAVAQACPEGAATTEPAPTWQPGDRWNYTLYEDGQAVGWIRWTVEAIEPVENQSDAAYRIDQATHHWGDHDHDGVPNETANRTIHMDTKTLNKVWNVCDPEPFGLMGPCQGRNPELDFPLYDGKTWARDSSGDVIVHFVHEARYEPTVTIANRSFTDAWVLEYHSPSTNVGTSKHVDVYDPDAGVLVYRVTLADDPDEPGMALEPAREWVLREQDGGEPNGTYRLAWVHGDEQVDPPHSGACDVRFNHRVLPAERSIEYLDDIYDFDPANVSRMIAFDVWEHPADCPVAYRLNPNAVNVSAELGGYGTLELSFEANDTLNVDDERWLAPGENVSLSYNTSTQADGTPQWRNGTITVAYVDDWPRSGLHAVDG